MKTARDIEYRIRVSEATFKAVQHYADVYGLSNEAFGRLALRRFFLAHREEVSDIADLLGMDRLGPARSQNGRKAS